MVIDDARLDEAFLIVKNAGDHRSPALDARKVGTTSS
jgi:hypothetical protein